MAFFQLLWEARPLPIYYILRSTRHCLWNVVSEHFIVLLVSVCSKACLAFSKYLQKKMNVCTDNGRPKIFSVIYEWFASLDSWTAFPSGRGSLLHDKVVLLENAKQLILQLKRPSVIPDQWIHWLLRKGLISSECLQILTWNSHFNVYRKSNAKSFVVYIVLLADGGGWCWKWEGWWRERLRRKGSLWCSCDPGFDIVFPFYFEGHRSNWNINQIYKS